MMPALPAKAVAREVLVVEDEPKIAALLCKYLQEAGFETEVCGDGLDALARIERDPVMRFCVVLLDVMLPGMDGLDLCRTIRQRSGVPILMLSARIEELDRLLGLELGADDYVCKPFSAREVVARVRALVRRAQGRLTAGASVPVPGSGGFSIDDEGMRVWWREQPVALTPVEYRLFRALVSQPGQVFERPALLDVLHQDFRDVSDRAVDSHIKNLRRKLEAILGGSSGIVAVYGVGYRFEAPRGG
jgi:two-component system, OmpR family, response regulator BaeR